MRAADPWTPPAQVTSRHPWLPTNVAVAMLAFAGLGAVVGLPSAWFHGNLTIDWCTGAGEWRNDLALVGWLLPVASAAAAGFAVWTTRHRQETRVRRRGADAFWGASVPLLATAIYALSETLFVIAVNPSASGDPVFAVLAFAVLAGIVTVPVGVPLSAAVGAGLGAWERRRAG